MCASEVPLYLHLIYWGVDNGLSEIGPDKGLYEEDKERPYNKINFSRDLSDHSPSIFPHLLINLSACISSPKILSL